MARFGTLFGKLAQTVLNEVQDENDEAKEIEEYKERAAENGDDLISVVTHVKEIKEKHAKKRKQALEKRKKEAIEIISTPPPPPPIPPVVVELNGGDLNVDKTNKNKIVKPPKKVSNTSGRDTKLPKVGKEAKDRSAKDKNYKTQAGDVTANSEDPSSAPTSLAIIALIGGAIGLGIYFYLK